MYLILLLFIAALVLGLVGFKSLQSKPVPGIPLLAGPSVAKRFGGNIQVITIASPSADLTIL
jgi:hypothetical protein